MPLGDAQALETENGLTLRRASQTISSELPSSLSVQHCIGGLLKRFFGIIGISLLVVAGVIYWWSERIADGSRLPSTNSVKMRIASGGVTIVGVPTNDYRVSLENTSPDIAKEAHIEIKRDHQPVTINLSNLPQGSRVRVEIPENSNLAVRMGAGELVIQGVHGNKYAMLRSGKLVIDVGDQREYSSANASVLAGAIHAPAFSTDKGGIFRYMSARGPNLRLSLDAHVSAGELVLQ